MTAIARVINTVMDTIVSASASASASNSNSNSASVVLVLVLVTSTVIAQSYLAKAASTRTWPFRFFLRL